jgi:membrane protein implicated in regulation of membrane protease activity
VIVAVAFGAIEIFTFSFGYLFASLGALVAAIVAYLGFGWEFSALAFTVTLLLTFWQIRPWMIQKFQTQTQLKDRFAELVGSFGKIQDAGDSDMGNYRVVIKGMDWAASGPKGLSAGDQIVVENIDGITLTIKKV